MEKFKLCPACGERVAPDMVFCLVCATDLSRVPVTDEALEAAKKQRAAEEAQAAKEQKEEAGKEKRAEEIAKAQSGALPKGRPIRICPECKHKNRMTARTCGGCGVFIGDVLPTADTPSFRLVSLRGEFFIPVCGNEPLVLGRGAVGWAQMKDAVYVSRRHARVAIKLDRLWIEPVGTAKIYVGGKLIDAPTPLSLGDEIGLAVATLASPHAEGAVFLRVEAQKE